MSLDLRRPAARPAPAATTLRLRSARPEDAAACGRILHDAFAGIAAAHGFANDFPSPDAATALVAAFVADPAVFAVVAEAEGRLLGSNFLAEGDAIRSVGPISVDPAASRGGIGRRLMQAVLDRAEGAAGVRLVQDSFNTCSVSLYATLGFEVKAPLLLLQGRPRHALPASCRVRPMQEADLAACDALCAAAHGITRGHELRQALGQHGPMVLEHRGRVTAYLTAPGLWPANHGVAESEEDMAALLAGAAAARAAPVALLLPGTQAGLLRWCLGAGMRAVKPMTLMARGFWQAPARCWFPSVAY